MSMLTIGICLAASIGIILFTAKQRLDYNKQLSAYIESTKNHQKVSFKRTSYLNGHYACRCNWCTNLWYI